HRCGDRRDEAIPARRIFLETPPPARRDGIELRLAIVVALPPLGLDEPIALETVERGIERPLWDLERVLGDLRDAEKDAVAVERAERHRLQDQHVERPGEELGDLGCQIRLSPRLSRRMWCFS